MKYERLIYVWTSMNAEVYLIMIRVLTRNQKADVSNILKVSLWQCGPQIIKGISSIPCKTVQSRQVYYRKSLY